MTVSGIETRQDWEYSRDIGLPFILHLQSGSDLRCDEVLRLLPGRRLVCRATVLGESSESVLVKLFMGKDQQREVAEDEQGVRSLLAAGIMTPGLIKRDAVQAREYPVLIFEFLHNASEFKDAWQRLDQRPRLLEQLLQMVGVQHSAGLRQRDFHLKNFLIGPDETLYAIDGGDYALGRVSKRRALQNLGMLFGHLPRSLLLQNNHCLKDYLDASDWSENQLSYSDVLCSADRFRRRRARRISSKAFRNCSEFVVRKYARYKIYQRRDLDAAQLDQWLDRQSSDGIGASDVILKPGNSQTVWRTEIAAQRVVVKRYNLKSWVYVLKRAVTRSRASHSWENAFRLRAYHIATPEPLAMIEERMGPFRRRAWLLTEWSEGLSAKQCLGEAEDNAETREILSRVAGVVSCLAINGVVHGDLKATNVLVAKQRIDLIDLDSMTFPRLAWNRQRGIAADKRRFMVNWQESWILPALKKLME